MILGTKNAFSLLSLIIAFSLSNQACSQNSISSNEETRVDSIFAYSSKNNFPGAAIIVAKDGKILYQKCFGYANIQHKVPVTIETKFRIGSITKQFTAAAIFKLQEQGLLTVNDPLSEFISDYPFGNKITIYHLLTQTSGIPNYTQKDGFGTSAKNPIEPDSLIKLFKADELEFSPGENWQYSNSNYFLLGYIIEKVSGKTYEEYLNEKFFIPLGMKNTGIHDLSKIYENEASGYEYWNEKKYNAEIRHGSHYGGAGNLYSTVKDLFIWNEAVFNGEALSQNSLKTIMTPVKWGEGKELTKGSFKYGCGWGMLNYQGIESIAHGGGFNGYDCWLSRYPAYNLTIVVLTNCNPFPEGLGSRAANFKIAEIFLKDYMNKH